MYNTKKNLICLIFMISATLSFNWPLAEYRVTSTFGESRYDHFHDGIDIISGNEAVYPVDEGELVFFWDRALFAAENYCGGGNYRVLRHKNDMYSVYMHLEDSAVYKRIYGRDEAVGKMGNTGRSFGRHLHFSIFKLKENISVNPYLLLTPVKDEKSPVISRICVRIGEKYYPVKDKGKIRLTQHYPLYFKIYDIIRGYENLGVYRLKLRLNGKELMNTEFSEIVFSGRSMTIGKNPYSAIYDENGYYRAAGCKYKSGKNTVEVIAVDFSGNSVKKEISFDVELDL